MKKLTLGFLSALLFTAVHTPVFADDSQVLNVSQSFKLSASINNTYLNGSVSGSDAQGGYVKLEGTYVVADGQIYDAADKYGYPYYNYNCKSASAGAIRWYEGRVHGFNKDGARRGLTRWLHNFK